ncbi:MAG: 50S ribosomal protein L25 [Saprospiraceae bacterium]|nr:50S ribosomal protein L25 [Saprospiraceae bacterium]MBP7642630.1 50S ribosomal protein L25 [Saprospiraceae bacterium]HMS68908.1 50S ribosomal protein L25 [Saprospiraceae bacterium]
MNTVSVSTQIREEVGSRGAKTARAEGMVPAVIYGSNDPIHVLVNQKEVKPLIYTPDFKLGEISVNGSAIKCIVKETQFHPVTDELLHVDFLALTPGKKIKVEVPVRFVGNSPGVKNGGKLIQQLRKIKIKTTPENMIEEINVDISHLELGQVLRVKNVQVSTDIELLVNPSIPIANIEIPRALKSAAAADAKSGGKKK